MWWSIGGGIIIFALGMFIFLKPGLIWKLTEEWKSYRTDEPSEFYLKTTKIGGILFAILGEYSCAAGSSAIIRFLSSYID